MNAIQRRRAIAQALVFGAALAIAGCVAPSGKGVAGRPLPTRAPPPVSAHPSPPLPNVDWRDVPVSAGDWAWSSEAGRSTARFAGDALVIRCELVGRVSISRGFAGVGDQAGTRTLTIRTTDTARTIMAIADQSRLVGIVSADDPLLDAMAFSRGRLMVSASGVTPLAVPSWSEIGRVIEDCRQAAR